MLVGNTPVTGVFDKVNGDPDRIDGASSTTGLKLSLYHSHQRLWR